MNYKKTIVGFLVIVSLMVVAPTASAENTAAPASDCITTFQSDHKNATEDWDGQIANTQQYATETTFIAADLVTCLGAGPCGYDFEGDVRWAIGWLIINPNPWLFKARMDAALSQLGSCIA